MSVRLRRLANDWEELKRYAADQDRVLIRNTAGAPPEKYQIEYRIRGLEMKGGEVVERSSHLVEIVLPLEYPTMEPKCRMLTPVFHPNISPQVICHTDHWAAGESLVDVVVRIGEMISYQNYNIKSPRNGEAARWAEGNMSRFPIDPAGLSWVRTQTEEGPPGPSDETTDVPEAGPSPAQDFACANCGAKGPATSFYECSKHHVVCPDCVLTCDGCGKRLCVLCSFSQCTSCKTVLCDECAVFCPSCGRPSCKAHRSECPACRTATCPDAPAASEPPGPSERGRPAGEAASPSSPPASCGKCGNVIEYWNAGFCPRCGTKLL
ncbi:MAG: Ubiquitin-conjugating enzyme [Candidatus Aminicenantes bacterium]|nr:Ubiquitin-conjugating enzyme [Candidatus Aminicenantes bacterium]